MTNEKAKKLITSISYLESELIIFQDLALKTKYKYYPHDVFDRDEEYMLVSKEEFIEYYNNLDDKSKNTIEALLNLIRKDVKVQEDLIEDKNGIHGAIYHFETDYERYQVKVNAPWWLLRIITPGFTQDTSYFPDFSLKELYNEACN